MSHTVLWWRTLTLWVHRLHRMRRRGVGLASVMILLTTSSATAAERFIQKVPLAPGWVAVVAEGDLEARSLGSYTVRTYSDPAATAGNETTFYAAGAVRSRDGTVRSAGLMAVVGRPYPVLMVVMQSAGSAGAVSADAFAIESKAVRWLASVSDLPPSEDPAVKLRQQLGDPASAARQFLRAYQPLSASGVPREGALRALLPHLHPSLRQSMVAVSQTQAASRCEGPPALQGDLISSLAEGPNAFDVGTCRIRPGEAICPVRFIYRGTAEGARWQDHLELTLQADRWRVRDVVQGAPWSARSRLTTRLAEALQTLKTCTPR